MKKTSFLLTLVLSLLLVACSDDSKSTKSDLTLQDFIEAFENEGVTVDINEKAMYSLIQAKDGVIFYMNNQPVKIYEYSTEKDIELGIEALPEVSEWDKNGNFVLETSNEKAKEIFNSVQ